MANLKSSIRAGITNYSAFQLAIAGAAIKRKDTPLSGSFHLLDALIHAPDEAAALALLNADPIHNQVPFIEQVPVQKNGETAWLSPVDHSLIRRLPVDPDRFRETIAELESLFSEPHPARFEPPRLDVLDAIARLRKELEREKSYVPTPLQFLEVKLEEYKTRSLKPNAEALMHTLLSVTVALTELRNSVELDGRRDAAVSILEQASRYLATPPIQAPWLTSYILALLLHPNVMATGWSRRRAKTMNFIRSEIEGGYYDGEETAHRLRRMEALGFPVNSLVYPLLRLSARARHNEVRVGT